MKIIIEYDNPNLKNISESLYNLFINNYSVTILNNTISQEEKNNFLEDNTNYFLLSNKTSNSNLEIIYPLKDTNQLAKELYDKLITITDVSKYYQLRSPNKTNLDYYHIFQNLNNNQGIIIKYGNNDLNNSNILLTIYQVINNYLNSKSTYIVQKGDSLYSISKKFNISVDELKKINNLSSNLLSIGQKIIIPNSNQSNINNTTNTENIYVVKSGDSLYAISKKFNTTVDELKKINNLSSNLLSIGQKLIIPNNETEISYIVQKGDSLYSISKKYNTTVDELKRINNLSSNLLSIGQKLIIKK